MGPIPAVLLRCYGVSEDETRNRCCRLLNEIMVGGCESEEAMARAYLWLFSELQKSHPILQFQESEESMAETSVGLLRGLLADWQK